MDEMVWQREKRECRSAVLRLFLPERPCSVWAHVDMVHGRPRFVKERVQIKQRLFGLDLGQLGACARVAGVKTVQQSA